MNTNLVNKVGSFEQDNLIAKLYPPALAFGVKIRALESGDPVTIKRGTALAKGADGYLGILGENASGAVTEDFNGDGTAKTFTLTASPLPLSVTAKVGDDDAVIDSYNAQTGVVTLHAAPAAGTKNVHISYSNPAADEPYAILADDVVVTADGAATAVAYRSGNFNLDAVIFAEDYTLSEADRDAFRHYDILFTDVM